MTAATPARIEVLTVPDCPHRELMVERLRQALDQTGRPDVLVTERVIDHLEGAVTAGMHGSPTVLIDGQDPFTADGTLGSVSCRLYATEMGIDGAPGVAELVEALSSERSSAHAITVPSGRRARLKA